MNRPKKIGVLTGGGDCPGLNAVIRAVTKTAIFRYGLEVVGIEDGFFGLIHDHMRPLSANDTSGILTRGGTILGTNNRSDPKNFAVERPGGVEFQDVRDQCATHLRQAGVEAVVVIGGDGTMSAAASLIGHGINFIGVPKTIDNDLVGTDVTFGFASAVSVATDALDRVHSTAESHSRAMVVEVMGRNAGWIALHAGVASGADVILIPEIPYDIESIRAKIESRRNNSRDFTILCVSEGARPRGGEQQVDQFDPTSPDPIRLGGIGKVVAEQIEEFAVESRTTVLGHIQRGGTPIAADRVLATEFGHHAIELLMQGQSNRLVVMSNGKVTHIELAQAANQQRLVPLDHPLLQAARAVGTCLGD